ncbi:hypothetical protein Q3H58_000749 [Pseudomonas psychrotolerans]|nr:hypothetical protein [Pseudomonas psychrotolerans]
MSTATLLTGKVVQGMDALRVALGHHHRLAGVHVVDDVDHLAALGLVEQLVDEQVALAGEQRRDQAGEGHHVPFHLFVAEALGDLGAEVDGEALGLLVGIKEADGWGIQGAAIGDLGRLGQAFGDLGSGLGEAGGEGQGEQAAGKPVAGHGLLRKDEGGQGG